MAVRLRRPSAKWLLVLGSAICFLIADGCTYSFGIFYTELSAVFADEYSPMVIALLSGMLYGLPQISGPLVCPLIEALGSVRACALGCLCVSVSFAVASFVPSFVGLLFTIGLVTSVGLELLYATALSVVLRNFRRWRGLATGVTVFGGGLGALLFAEIYSALERRYTWRGAMFVEAAIFSHTAVSACLYLLMEGREKEEERPLDGEMMEVDSSYAHASGQELLSFEVRQSRGDSQTGQASLAHDWAEKQSYAEVTLKEKHELEGEPVRRFTDSDSFPGKSPKLVLKEHGASYTLNEASAGEEKRASTLSLFWDQLVTSFKAMRHPILWRLPFVHFRIVSLLLGILVLQPWIFIHSYAVQLGSPPSKANHVLSVMGISYAVGQIVFGPLADVVNAYLLYGGCVLMCGAACLWMGFCSAFWCLTTLGAAFGVGMGGTMALFGLLLVDLVGEEQLYPAFGVFLPFVGVGNLISGPLSAWLATRLSYQVMFTIGGVGIMAISLLFSPLAVRSVRRCGVRPLGHRS